MISVAPPAFRPLPERDTSTPSRSGKIVDATISLGERAGEEVCATAGAWVGCLSGAARELTSAQGWRGMLRSGSRALAVGAAVGSVAGALHEGMVGAASGAAIGAVTGLAAGAVGQLGIDSLRQGAVTAERYRQRGAAPGRAVARGVLHGIAGGMVRLSHFPGMRRLGHRIIYREQKEPGADTWDRCHQVDAQVFRGSQPGTNCMADIAGHGFKTIINLRYETDFERPQVQALGMQAVYIPEAGMDAPTMQDALRFVSIARDPAQQPVYFHCYSGVDRTGTMAACYRIAVQNWTAQAAIDESVRLGMVEDLDGAKVRFIRQFDKEWQARAAATKGP